MRERMNKSALCTVSIPGHHVVSCELPSPAEFGQLTGQGPVPTTARQVDDPEMGATAACASWLGDITRMSWDRACGEPWGWDGSGYRRDPAGTGVLCCCNFARRLAVMGGLLGQPYFYILARLDISNRGRWRWQVPAMWCLFPAGLGVVCGETCWDSGRSLMSGTTADRRAGLLTLTYWCGMAGGLGGSGWRQSSWSVPLCMTWRWIRSNYIDARVPGRDRDWTCGQTKDCE